MCLEVSRVGGNGSDNFRGTDSLGFRRRVGDVTKTTTLDVEIEIDRLRDSWVVLRTMYYPRVALVGETEPGDSLPDG